MTRTGRPPARPFLDEVTIDPAPMRIAWSAKAPLGISVPPECVQAVRTTAARLEELGHHVVEDDPVYDEEVLIDPMLAIWSVENAAHVEVIKSRIGRPPETMSSRSPHGSSWNTQAPSAA